MDENHLFSIIMVCLSLTIKTALSDEMEIPARFRQKRQIFREQLLPSQGGRIPESAFDSVKISLNKLNQNGLYYTDGMYLQDIQPKMKHSSKYFFPKTLKIKILPNNRFVFKIDNLATDSDEEVDTTYKIAQHSDDTLTPPKHSFSSLPIIPRSSLYLLRRKENNQNRNTENDCNLCSKEEYNQIFLESTPYLWKLHQYSPD